MSAHTSESGGFVTELSGWDYVIEKGEGFVKLRSRRDGEASRPSDAFEGIDVDRFRESTSVYIYDDVTLKPHAKTYHSLKSTPYSPDLGFSEFTSVGAVYSKVSTAIFGDWNQCGKVMGLATYSENAKGGVVSGDLFGKLEIDQGR